MGAYMQEAQKGKQFFLTENGYNHTPDNVKHERNIGEPIKGFETRVPVSWIKKGYVEEQSNHISRRESEKHEDDSKRRSSNRKIT